MHRQLVHPARTGQFQLEMPGTPFRGQQQFLHLGWEQIHPAQDDHVIRPPGDLLHPPHPRPRRARQQAGEVAGAVADDREGLLAQRGEHQLALLALGQHLAGLGIDDLRVEMILPDMQPVLGLHAFLRHTRPQHFRQAVNIGRIQPERAFDLAAQRVRPRLCAENAIAQAATPRIDPRRLEAIEQRQHIAGRDHDDLRLEIGDQLHLPLGHSARDRHHRATKPLRPAMRAQAAGEQAVAIGHMHHHPRTPTRRPDRARHQIGPHLQIRLGVAHHHRLARGAGGGVDARNLLPRHREHAERIGVAQVGLHREREFRHVRQLPEIIRMHALCHAFRAVMRHVVIGMPQRPRHPAGLQRHDLIARCTFGGVV